MTNKKAGRVISMGPTKTEPKQREVPVEVSEEEAPLLEGQTYMYVLDPAKIKTIEDVAIILDGLHIGLVPDHFNALEGRVQQLFTKAIVDTVPKSHN